MVYSMILNTVLLIYLGYRIVKNRPPSKKIIYTMDDTCKDFRVTLAFPETPVVLISIGPPGDDKGIPYGWVLVSEGHKAGSCYLWDILVKEKYRRQGYACAMLNYLKSQYDEIHTQYDKDTVTTAGTMLCLKNGFKKYPSIKKREPGQLIWRRGE